jgi:hypothetical protein
MSKKMSAQQIKREIEKLACGDCKHFFSLHGPKGCSVQWCDCALREKKQTLKGR